MLVHILGSCSGTEPMPGRHHTSIAVAFDNRLFWLDAGECCSHTAHLLGLDLPATEAIFISHTHMDHIGGLANLLWTLRKLTKVSAEAKTKLADREIELFIPDLQVYQAVHTILKATEENFAAVFTITPKTCREGIIHQRADVTVTALPNRHLGTEGPARSFSFRFEGGGKSLVYSGDVKHISDFAPLIDPCDLLLMETGHHQVEEICLYLQKSKHQFGRLILVHHGRAILADAKGELEKARRILGPRVMIADDGLRIKV